MSQIQGTNSRNWRDTARTIEWHAAERELEGFIEDHLKGPVILDPTILVSKRHIDQLAGRGGDLFVPATISELIRERDWDTVEAVVADLSWLFTRRPIIEAPGVKRQLIRAIELAAPYEAAPEIRRRLGQLYPDMWDFDDPTDRVLADEYSFLVSHSSLLARIRRPFYVLREKGLIVLDAGNRLNAAKKRVVARYRNLKVFVGTMVALAGLAESLPVELRLLRFLGAELLVVYDPSLS